MQYFLFDRISNCCWDLVCVTDQGAPASYQPLQDKLILVVIRKKFWTFSCILSFYTVMHTYCLSIYLSYFVSQNLCRTFVNVGFTENSLCQIFVNFSFAENAGPSEINLRCGFAVPYIYGLVRRVGERRIPFKANVPKWVSGHKDMTQHIKYSPPPSSYP